MSEPKVVHQLKVVRVALYFLQHLGETWLFNCQASPKTLYVYTDTDWAADEVTRKSVSCTVVRYGSHMLDCGVAKQSLVAVSSGEAEFYGLVRAVVTSTQTSQILEPIGMRRMDSAERLIETGIGSLLHRHDDNSWFVPSFSSGHIVVTLFVDVSPTCACAISCILRHTTGMMYRRIFHGVLSNFGDGRCHACSSVDASDGRCLDGFQQRCLKSRNPFICSNTMKLVGG